MVGLNFNSKNTMHTIRYSIDYKGSIYTVKIKKPREIFLSIHLARVIFFLSLNKQNQSSYKNELRHSGGGLKPIDIEEALKCTVLEIVKNSPEAKIFNDKILYKLDPVALHTA